MFEDVDLRIAEAVEPMYAYHYTKTCQSCLCTITCNHCTHNCTHTCKTCVCTQTCVCTMLCTAAAC